MGNRSASEAKETMRAQALLARREMAADQRTRAEPALADAVAAAVPERGWEVVCAFAPTPMEPPALDWLDSLVHAGAEVLLPLAADDGDLDWAPYEGADRLTPGAHRLLEPMAPALGRDAIADAAAVLAPALSVDPTGTRLGRGGGYYDRALARCPGRVELVAVVFDHERVRHVPREQHDVRVTTILSPGLGLTPANGTFLGPTSLDQESAR